MTCKITQPLPPTSPTVSVRNDMQPPEPITYKDAGVDIEAGDELVERIKPAVKRTQRPEVLGGLG